MSREWKPGDVVTGLLDGNEIVGIVRGGGKRMFYADSVTTDQVDLKHVRNLRPLVVIDPEDAEAVERLLKSYWSAMAEDDNEPLTTRTDTDYLQAALREFADPKPKCPAALVIKGEHFACDSAEGHGLPHGNSAAEAIWGEPE